MACLVLLVAAFSATQTTATPATSAPAPRPASTIQAAKVTIEKADAGPGWFEFLFWSPLSGWIVGLAGIAATAYFALRYRQTKKLSFSCRNYDLLRAEAKLIEQLKVFYDDVPVPNLTVCALDLWNEGSATIDRNDIAPKDPIRVTIVGGRLLRIQSKVAQDDVASNLEVIRDPENEDSFRLTFDFLDPGKGGKFGIYHTSVAADPVHVTGTIKGAGHPTLRSERAPRKTLFEQYAPSLIGLLYLTLLCVIFAAWMERIYQTPIPDPLFWALLIVPGSSLIALVLLAKVHQRSRERTKATAAGEGHDAD